MLSPRPFGPRRFVHLFLSLTLVALATTVPASPTNAQAAVDRLWGQDRYATAAAISRATFAAGVGVAFVATGGDFPDSLAGGPAAATLGAPILLVTRNSVPAATRAELQRLQPGRIDILGGEGVVSSAVAAELQAYTGGRVGRHAGSNRYATAAAISQAHFNPSPPVAYVATGRSFPDALAAGAAAAALKGPVLLVEPSSIPAPAAAELGRLRPQRIVVVGGPAVVSDAVLGALAGYTSGGVSRQAGMNRYGTAAAISSNIWATGSSPTVFLANGLGFADAVAGVSAAAAAGGPLLLAAPGSLPSETTSELRRLNPSRVVLLGGTGALADGVGTAAAASSTLTLVGPWAFAVDQHALKELNPNADELIYYGDSLLPIYGPLDGSGVFMHNIGGVLYDHPVGQAQYVVNMLRNYRLQPDADYLNRAIANANRLLDRAVSHAGGIFFPYPFDFGLHGRGTLRAPWFSGMAQGIALSGFVRLYERTGDNKWLDAANRTFASFLVRPEPGKPWVTGVDGGMLWFEEYPWSPYDHTYNGHNFAMFGVHDYWRLTRSADANQLLMGALTTTTRMASRVRVTGGVSNYCLAKSCLDRQVRNQNYHLVHISQSLYLHRYTGEEQYAQMADNFVADYPDFRHGGTTVFAPGQYTAYNFDSGGNAIPAKTSSIPSTSTASYSERSVPYGWSRPGNGIWFRMNDGEFAGLWVPETAQTYARGFVDRYSYLWPRASAVTGGQWTGFQIDPSTGAATSQVTIETGATTWTYRSSARINGQRAILLDSGPLAGYWLPTTQGATLGVAAETARFGAAAAGEAGAADEPAADLPLAPVPSGQPTLMEPMPGQMDLPSEGP